jgi:hypothetical protein
MATIPALPDDEIRALETKILELNPRLRNSTASQLAFINQLAPAAQEIGRANDLWPSVMIAQAILESAWGTSTLSQSPNHNLFGIKGEFNGQFVEMRTWEDDGRGNVVWITARFRRYPSYRESFQDYADVIRRVSFTPGVFFYAGAWRSNTNSFRDATAWLQGRYATDTQYAAKLNNLITTHNLTRFDGANVGHNTNVAEVAVNQQFRTTAAINLRSAATTASLSVGSVANGTTVNVTARRIGTSVLGNTNWFRLSTGGWISGAFLQEGTSNNNNQTQTGQLVPIFRIYSPRYDYHLFTDSAHERNEVVRVGWGQFEKVAFNALSNGNVQIFRLYNPRTARHLFTTSAYERDVLRSRGWNFEKVAFRVNSNGPIPVFRLYNPRTDRHLFTTSAHERDVLVSRGWNNEGVAWRAN